MRKMWGVTVAVLTALSMVACSDGIGDGQRGEAPETLPSTDFFGYLVDTPLLTTNAGSEVGSSSNTEALSGRLYPAVFVPGPSGQMIPNTDLVTTQVLPGANRQVVYTLTENARYSDGEPVTCTDFLLHYKAGVHDSLFGSHLPQTDEVLRLECEPGQKRFTVVFKENSGGRWRHLFGHGTVLPSHAVAAKVGLTLDELHTALVADDWTTLAEIAPVWRDGFDLDSFDPALQVTSGPFVIDEVGEQGEVILVPNEHYYGDAPNLQTIVVWPGGTDPEQLDEAGALRIADVRQGQFVNRDDPTNTLTIEERVGDLTDTLVLANAGVLGSPQARQAFAACVDQRAVAAESSRVSGIEVPPAGLHSLQHNDPLAPLLLDLAEKHMGVDIDRARSLGGTTVRIGFAGPNERKSAMVESIRASCEPAGITVVDASEEGGTLADLARVDTGQWGEQVVSEGELDAVLVAVDPLAEVSSASARASALADLRTVEEELWEEVPSIPLSAQPRRFVIDRTVGNVVVYTGLAGIGWNMDRWLSEDDGGPADADE